MRVVDCQTLELVDFIHKVPPYGILSHTWDLEEVSFLDFQDPKRASRLKGYEKITSVCGLALTSGYRYCWIDTCCIDKSSSAELSEAINSMFTWYQNAAICYVWLLDLVTTDGLSLEKQLGRCRWFTRGWTLQELIAPVNVEFYDCSWRLIATKTQLSSILSTITRIDEGILTGAMQCDEVLVAKRMSWASKRTTTRPEDLAYCLLGIFDLNMPLLYGEGPKAFVRLQQEIIRSSTDLSLFAWESANPSNRYRGLLARSPDEFADCADLVPSNSFRTYFANEYIITNNRLRIQHMLRANRGKASDSGYILPLQCKSQSSSNESFIKLCQCGNSLFVRMAPYEVSSTVLHQLSAPLNTIVPHYILLHSPHSLEDFVMQSGRNGIKLKLAHNMRIRAHSDADIYPWPLWDIFNGLLFSDGQNQFWGKCTININHTLPFGRRSVSVSVICGKCNGDVGFFCALEPVDEIVPIVPRDVILAAPPNARAIYNRIPIYSRAQSLRESFASVDSTLDSNVRVRTSIRMKPYEFGVDPSPAVGAIIEITSTIIDNMTSPHTHVSGLY
ncbi:hypothetical protein MMC25_005962 [Agyrium rufum]|nr:hypothetical protein [Agyrium rufum]